MILRRLTTALRKQDWVTVVIETLIVVLGVFLGIQLGNWNAARADRQLGAEYAERLIADLETNHQNSAIVAAYYEAVLDAAIETDRLLAEDAPDPTALVMNAYRASEVTHIPAARSTWDQIVSSGHLILLPAGADELTQYYANNQSWQTYQILQPTEYRRAVRRVIPVPVQIAIREGCSDVRDDVKTITGFVTECRIDVPDAALAEVARNLHADPEVRATLGTQYSELVGAVLNQRGDVATIENALAALRPDADAD